MPHRDHAEELESAADRIMHISQPDLQIMLRHAAVTLRNANAIEFEPEIENALRSIAADMKVTRNDAVRGIVLEWLESEAYLPARPLKGYGDTEGGA